MADSTLLLCCLRVLAALASPPSAHRLVRSGGSTPGSLFCPHAGRGVLRGERLARGRRYGADVPVRVPRKRKPQGRVPIAAGLWLSLAVYVCWVPGSCHAACCLLPASQASDKGCVEFCLLPCPPCPACPRPSIVCFLACFHSTAGPVPRLLPGPLRAGRVRDHFRAADGAPRRPGPLRILLPAGQ